MAEADGGPVRWRASALLRRGPVAIAFSPDASLLVLGSAEGELVWLRVRDGALLLRMQLEDAIEGGAVLTSPDQRIAVLGQMRAPWRWAVCRCGAEAIPWPLCSDAREESNLLARALSTTLTR